jgi:hypothetical protein
MTVPDDVVERARKLLWEIYRSSKIAAEAHKDISWETIRETSNQCEFASLIIETADREARAALRVGVEWERERDKWLPIETAPKDGTPILCCWEDQPFDATIMACEGDMFGWLTEEMDFICKPNMQPSHWMPIPRHHRTTPDDCNPSDYT